MSKNIKTKDEKFLKWCDDLRNSFEKEVDYWNLARSRDPKLYEKINIIQAIFKKIDERIKSGKTYCLVFDSKKYTSETVPDALVGETVSAKLDPKQEYYLKGDKDANVARVIERKSPKSKEISKIVVPTKQFPSLETLRMTLSPSTYFEFLKQCEQKEYFVDAMIVTLNSVTDFDDDDMKLLLNEVKQRYQSPFLILNDAPPKDCVMIDDCDICYEDKRELLHRLTEDENRFYKVSSRNIIHNHGTSTNIDFELFKKTLEENVNMEAIVGHFFKRNKTIMESFENIMKTMHEDKNNIKIETDTIEKKLHANKPKIDKYFDEGKQKTSTKVENQMIDFENGECINQDYVKDNIAPIINEQFSEFGTTMHNQIMEVIKSKNPEFENYTANMCLKEYLNPEASVAKLIENINNIADEMIKEVNINEELVEKEQKKSMFSRFLSSTKDFITNTYDSIKLSFEKFVDQFKDKIMEKYHKFEIRIKEVVDNYSVCLLKDKNNEIENSLQTIKCKIDYRKHTLRLMINDNIRKINEKINEKKNVNIYPNNITYYLDRSESISTTLSNKIEFELLSLCKEIQNDITKLSKNDLLKNWLKDLSDEYANTSFYNEGRFRSQSSDIITNLYRDLCANSLYTMGEYYETRNRDQWSETEVGMAGGALIVSEIVGSVVPIVGHVVGGALGAIWGAFGGKKETREVIEERTYKFITKKIKENDMIIKVDDIDKRLKTISDSILDDISESFKGFLRRKNLLI